MKRYLYIYFLFIKLSFSELAAFRANFYNSVFSHVLWASFTFITMFLLTAKTKQIYGWNREELFLLTAVFNIISGLFRTMISKNMDKLPRAIHNGQLDQYLLKPIDSQFWVSLRYVNLGPLVRVPIASYITFFIAVHMGITISFLQFMVFLLLLLLGIVILYSIWFITMTLVIWFTNLMNLDSLLNTLTGTTRYPKEIFENTALFFFLIFMPLTLIVSVPTEFILGKATQVEIIVLFSTAVILFIISRLFWKFALRYYTSASG